MENRKRIKEPKFDYKEYIRKHTEIDFNTLNPNYTISSKGTVQLPSKCKNYKKGIYKLTTYKNLKYKLFKKINQAHIEYLNSLKETSPIFIDAIKHCELTGAELTVGNIDKSKIKTGIVVEERVNTLVLIFKDDKVKMYPKDVSIFKLLFDNKEYFFIGNKMKLKRFYK